MSVRLSLDSVVCTHSSSSKNIGDKKKRGNGRAFMAGIGERGRRDEVL